MRWSSLEVDGNLFLEFVMRAFLSVLFLELEGAHPFIRKIQPEELWLYKNPRTDSYVPTTLLWPFVFVTPIVVIFAFYFLWRNKTDLCQAVLALSLALALNGVITNIIKLVVGRPRPDFFWRCFPDGKPNADMKCTGDHAAVIEGRKSFPSGHSSFSFASMGFTFFFVAGKLHVFNPRGRGQSWRLVASLVPLVVSLSIALSRTCDYHHHWQDVMCGSLLGLSVAYLCYRQYYPRLTSLHSDKPYTATSQHSNSSAFPSVHANAHGLETVCYLNDEQIKMI